MKRVGTSRAHRIADPGAVKPFGEKDAFRVMPQCPVPQCPVPQIGQKHFGFNCRLRGESPQRLSTRLGLSFIGA